MTTFNLTISSPDGNLLSDDVNGLFLRGLDGDLAILAGHISFVTAVRPCDCKIKLANGSEKCGHTDGGLLVVSEENVHLLSGTFHWN